MNEPEKQTHRKKAAVILAAGVVLTFLWSRFWHDGRQCWSVMEPLLPQSWYFPVEEFLALNDHNSPWNTFGIPVISIGFLIWAIRTNGRKLYLWEKTLVGMIIFLILLFSQPCLCAPKEKFFRVECVSAMRTMRLELLDRYPDRLPNHVQIKNRDGHAVRYLGKGRSWKEPKFILFEDAERCHAGDLRHRYWSDGTVDHYYPWKDAR